MISSSLLLFYVIFFSILANAFDVNNKVRKYTKPNSCKHDEYFNIVTLSCSQCDISKHHVPAEDGLQCKCDEFSKMISFENGEPLCIPCDSNMIPTADGRSCILQRNSKCNCLLNQIKVDRNINGTMLDNVLCVPCIQGTYPSPDCSKCLPCDREHSGHMNCLCPSSSHVILWNYCLNRKDVIDWPNIRSTYLIKFQSQNIDSYYLRNELQVAAYFCKRKDKVACEHLSNICALTLYTDDIACMFFKYTPIAPVWLFYNKEDTMALKNNTKISQRYSLRKEDETSTLDFAIVKFALNGEFLFVGSPTLPCQFLNNVRFGVNYSKKCELNIAELLNARVELLSPYLVFNQNNESFTHPLPVIVKSTDQVSNQNIEELWQQQLVRKFFLIDNISGFKAVPDFMFNKFTKEPKLHVLRYMKSLTVLVNVQNGEDHGKIFAPFLIVEYDELTDIDLITHSVIEIDYKVTFILKDNNIDYNFQVIIKVLIGIAVIFSNIKAFSYVRRNYGNNFNTSSLLWVIIYGLGAVGDVITFVCIIMCIYLFVFYKGQTIPYILLPDEKSEKHIRLYMMIAFSFKIVEMLAFAYQHWGLNIFFIDWEQPKTIQNQPIYDSPHTSLRKLYSNRFPRREKSSKISSVIIASKRKRRLRETVRNASPDETSRSSSSDRCTPNFSSICSIARSPLEESSVHSHVHNSPISIWRTYFIANEWCKLQTKRKINVALQSIYTLCILQVFDLDLWMLTVPEWANADKSSDAENNFILQYAICTFVYVCVYFAQWLIHVTFYERYIKNRLQEFVDLCSVANISVFLVQNYHGFYIHGRSVHGFADTDLPTLINDLKKEDDNLCAHRGLVPGTTTQTFILSLNQSFKSLYDEFMKQNESIVIFKGSDASSKNWKQLFETKSKMRLFLMQFLDHCSESEDYVIKEQHILEKLCDIHFSNIKSRSSKDKSIFYIDNNYSFKRMVLYGNEWLLATFEITTFAFFLVIYNSCIFACMATVIVSQLFLIIIRCNVKRNLCKKSLLDERFLM